MKTHRAGLWLMIPVLQVLAVLSIATPGISHPATSAYVMVYCETQGAFTGAGVLLQSHLTHYANGAKSGEYRGITESRGGGGNPTCPNPWTKGVNEIAIHLHGWKYNTSTGTWNSCWGQNPYWTYNTAPSVYHVWTIADNNSNPPCGAGTYKNYVTGYVWMSDNGGWRGGGPVTSGSHYLPAS